MRLCGLYWVIINLDLLLAIFDTFWLPSEAHKGTKSGLKQALFLTHTHLITKVKPNARLIFGAG
jgi:hypothetical protein